jgi:LPS export ABC transporter protein LptC
VRKWKPAAAVFILILGGCSLDYRAADTETADTRNVPDTSANDVVYRIMRDGRLSFQLEAERIDTYKSSKQTVLSKAHFTEFSEDGKLATDGRGDAVVFNTDSENAEITGSVSVYSASEEGDISAEALSWSKKEKLLTTDPKVRVIVRKDDGSYISGKGFVGDFRVKEMRFSGPVEGRYVYEDK